MVYSRDFYVAYGADTVLILYGDTLAATSGIISSVLSDGVTITGNGTSGNELKVDTATVISTIKGLVDTLAARGYLQVTQLTDTLDANTRGYLTAEVDGSISNELQTISTSGAAGNITLSDGGGTLNLNVDDADASVSNEGSLTVGAGTASTSVISSNTSGSTDVTLTAGSNITLSEAGNNITIAATGGGTSYNNISETADTVFITGDLNVDANTLRVDATTNRVYVNKDGIASNLDGNQYPTYPNISTMIGGALMFSDPNKYGFFASPNNIHISRNAYWNGTTDWKYIDTSGLYQTNAAGLFAIGNGTLNFLNSTNTPTINGNVAWVQRFIIDATGNVGIGTSTPISTLHVVGRPNFFEADGTNFEDDVADGQFTVNYKNQHYTAGSIDETAAFQFSFNNGGAAKLVCGKTEDFGSSANRSSYFSFETRKDGTYYSGLKLQENGLVYMPQVYATATTGTRTVYINSDGQLVANSSSIKTKDIVGNYDKGIDWIKKLNPIYYTYKKDDRKLIQAGFIAEEFDLLGLNEFVGYSLDGDADGINYAQLTTLTVKAIQEQQEQIETLQTELDAKSLIIETQQQTIIDLQTTIQALITRIEILENK